MSTKTCRGCKRVLSVTEFYIRCRKCKRCNFDSVKLLKRKRRAELIKRYGGKCVCCGETRYNFLTFDHVNNNGAEERRKFKGTRGTGTFLYKLYHGPIREDIVILCYNCNCSKGFYGECPHTTERRQQARSVSLRLHQTKTRLEFASPTTFSFALYAWSGSAISNCTIGSTHVYLRLRSLLSVALTKSATVDEP